MNKIRTLRVAASLFVLLLTTSFLTAPSVSAQIPIGIPKTLYRFVTPNSQLSRTFLTTDFQEGVDRGYIFWDQIGTVITPPAPGWVPAPNQGLAPMYRWRVDHTSGTNYYYSGGLWPNLLNNPENHLEGITGYALFPGATVGTFGVHLHLWYSQAHGYFYSVNGSTTYPAPPPPGQGSWTWQGVAYTLPFGFTGPIPGPCIPALGCFLFTPPPPPPPPPTCDPNQQQACENNGGNWNSTNCSCSYPPPDPCRQTDPTPKGSEPPEKGGELRPVMPCRQVQPF